jgi:hypothetical protein
MNMLQQYRESLPEFSTLMEELKEYVLAFPMCRKGQALMNILHIYSPLLSHELLGTKADCFYDDTRVLPLLEEIYGSDNIDYSYFNAL